MPESGLVPFKIRKSWKGVEVEVAKTHRAAGEAPTHNSRISNALELNMISIRIYALRS